MTISNTHNTIKYTGNGSVITYPYTYVVLDASHMVVTLNGVEQTTGYTVTGVGNASGGNVQFDTAPADQVAIILQRVVPLTQVTDYEEYDPFSAEDHENALDKLTMIDQQQQEELDRTLKTAVGDDAPPTLNLGDSPEGKVLQVDENGNYIIAEVSATELLQAKTDAEASATAASSSASAAATSQSNAHKWATNPEDNLVDDSTNTPDYSAYHYAQKAADALATGFQARNGVVSGTGDILTDFNAMDWTGNQWATGTAFEILSNTTASFYYDGVNYAWYGQKPANVGTGGNYSAVAGDLQVISTAAVQTGFKNVLINGDFRINQRGFDGNWEGLAQYEHGYDGWEKPDPGIILQYIENNNFTGNATYTLSWDGGGSGRFGGGSAPQDDTIGVSPLTGIMIPGGFIPFVSVPNTATNIQLERGSVATPLEVRNIQQERAMCERLYVEVDGLYVNGVAGDKVYIPFPTTMRVAPTSVAITGSGTATVVAQSITTHGFRAAITSDGYYDFSYTASVEL